MMDTSQEDQFDRELSFNGNAHFILNIAPFKLLLRTRGRLISRFKLVSELNFHEHQHRFAAADLRELFPIGGEVQIQLNTAWQGGPTSIVSATIVGTQHGSQQLLLELRLKKMDDEFEEFLTELRDHNASSGLRM